VSGGGGQETGITAMVWSDRRVREEKLSWWRRRAEQVELRDSEQSRAEQSRAEQSDRPDQGAQE